jgi:hypothetical protein
LGPNSIEALVKGGEPAKVIKELQLATELLESSTEPINLYNAACCMSLASSIEDSGEGGMPAERQARKTRDADRAIGLLKSAIDHGLSQPSLPKTDPDFDPVRKRADFVELIRRLETKTKDADRADRGQAVPR